MKFDGLSDAKTESGLLAIAQNSSGGTGLLDAPEAASHEVNAAAAYLAELHSEASLRAVRSRLNVIARWFGFPDAVCCPWGKLRYAHAVAFVHEFSDKRGLSATSVNAYLSALKGVAETAWRLRQLDLETYSEIKAVKQLRVHREPRGRALSLEESGKLLAAADEEERPSAVRDQAVIALLLGCGLRRAEATTLRMEHLNMAEGSLRVLGKGNKERTVFLTPAVSARIHAWLAVRGPSPGWLFGRYTKGGKLILDSPLDPASIGRIVAKALNESGIEHITTHDLRRTFATRLLSKNVDIVAVKNLMGHANVTTTAKYDRRTADALKEAVNQLDL